MTDEARPLEERVGELERLVGLIRARLGMADDGLPVGTAGVVLAPNQAPDPHAARVFDQMARVQKGMSTPPLTPQEAVAKYESEATVTAHFKEPLRLVDGEDFTAIVCPPGWHRLPRRFAPQLQGMATVVPEELAPA